MLLSQPRILLPPSCPENPFILQSHPFNPFTNHAPTPAQKPSSALTTDNFSNLPSRSSVDLSFTTFNHNGHFALILVTIQLLFVSPERLWASAGRRSCLVHNSPRSS